MAFNVWQDSQKFDLKEMLNKEDSLYLHSLLNWQQEKAELANAPLQEALDLQKQKLINFTLFKKGLKSPKKSFKFIAKKGFNFSKRVYRYLLRNIKQQVLLTFASSKNIDLKLSKQPLVSVVIPVYNLLPITLNCLRCISAAKDDTPCEVIVVDDCSPNQNVQSVLSQIPNLRYFRRDKNGGFVAACNTGASKARGKFIHFLNNDTAVQNNWLSSYLPLFKDPKVGAVGSKLLFPNLTLQEAGGIIFKTADGWNYGRYENAGEAQYNYVREVDYCSGASLAVKRDLFEQIGGFKKDLSPGYYEDTELCFALRERGYRVMYQPKSVVIHFEGATSKAATGKQTPMKHYQKVNYEKFKKMRAQDLARQLANPNDPEKVFLAARRKYGKKILVTDRIIPTYDRDYGSARTLAVLKALAKNHTVTFLPAESADNHKYREVLEQLGIEVILHLPGMEIEKRFKDEGRFYDLIISMRPDVTHYFYHLYKRFFPQAKLIFDTHDIHHLRIARQIELEKNKNIIADLVAQEKNFRFLENKYGNLADATWAITSIDQDYLKKFLPGKLVDVVSTAHKIKKNVPAYEKRQGVYFIGSFGHAPNAAAVKYFLKDILPLIKKKIPDLKTDIVGGGVSKELKDLADQNVSFLGYVNQEDMPKVYNQHRVFICPITFGSGLRGKIVMAQSQGVPVVSTSVGCEGILAQPDQEIALADDPQSFANKVVEIYKNKDLWQRLSRGGQEFINKNYSQAKLIDQIKISFKNLSIWP